MADITKVLHKMDEYYDEDDGEYYALEVMFDRYLDRKIGHIQGLKHHYSIGWALKFEDSSSYEDDKDAFFERISDDAFELLMLEQKEIISRKVAVEEEGNMAKYGTIYPPPKYRLVDATEYEAWREKAGFKDYDPKEERDAK